MSFSIVHPGGWAFGEKLTSAQMNQLDADHANALDKSVAGDSIAGTITFTGGGQINANGPSAIVSNIPGGIRSLTGQGISTSVAGGITSSGAGGIQGTVSGAIVPTVAGGISDGGIAQGIKATVFEGIFSHAIGGIITDVAGGIKDGVAGGIEIDNPGGLVVIPGSGQNGILIVSSNSWIGYQTPRSLTKFIPLNPGSSNVGATFGTGWSASTAHPGALVGGATTNAFTRYLNGMLTGQVNGLQLTAATLVFAVNDAHAGGVPFLPSIDIRRQGLSAGSAQATASLFSGGPQSMNNASAGWTVPLTGAAWNASGNIQNYPTAPDQNRSIDLSQFGYHLTVTDESAANSVAGNAYYGILLQFTNILNDGPC